MRLPLLLLINCALVCGADLTGRWTGTIAVDDTGSGTTITTQVHIELQQKGDGGVSGKIGRVEDTEVVAIKNARMEGDTLSFEAASDETTGPMKFSLKIAGDSMEGTMKGSIDSGDINGKVKLTREKTASRPENPSPEQNGKLIATLSFGCDSPPTCIKS
jgi:hypothetical protein